MIHYPKGYQYYRIYNPQGVTPSKCDLYINFLLGHLLVKQYLTVLLYCGWIIQLTLLLYCVCIIQLGVYLPIFYQHIYYLSLRWL